MGTMPIALGVERGEMMLAVAVFAIIITSPLGAIAIKKSAPRLLTFD